MGAIDSERRIREIGEEGDFLTSALQLRLAAGVVTRLVERNGGCEAAGVFWDEDSLDAEFAEDEYLDPESWDPDEETLPEMAIINENIFGGL
jgi:hypothetical protein